MSKFIKTSGNLTLKTSSSGTIYLDTGTGVGTVEVSGDLIVRGTTTTVNSTVVDIADNVIVLNSGETGAGVTAGALGADRTSGLLIDRGTEFDVLFKYHDDTPDPINVGYGLFRFTNDQGGFVGIATNHISTSGSNLTLVNSTSGVVTVGTSVNYENRVVDPNHMPNKKYVDDAITTAFATVLLPQIGDGILDVSGIVVSDNETSGVDSVITFSIDGNAVSSLYADRWEFDEIRIAGTIIETLSSNEDLVLRSPGTGSVRIDDTLHINSVPGDDDIILEPSVPTDGARIYVADQYTGKSGIYFVNQNNTRDELVSKNRALLFGMLF
jgi:hypothetical protein